MMGERSRMERGTISLVMIKGKRRPAEPSGMLTSEDLIQNLGSTIV
jgi:hypothetical protein